MGYNDVLFIDNLVIAQLVERGTVNPEVVGSKPTHEIIIRIFRVIIFYNSSCTLPLLHIFISLYAHIQVHCLL